MIRRFVSFVIIVWLLGFVWFAVALPRPAEAGKTDAVIVLTGAEGRIPRGLAVLNRGLARHMLVSGVDREVRPQEFEAQYKIPSALMQCCVTLDYEAVDTRSNAKEAADWIAANKFSSVRLVTTDWHMRRAAMEFEPALPADIAIIHDAVQSQPSLRILFLEYNKLLARAIARLWA